MMMRLPLFILAGLLGLFIAMAGTHNPAWSYGYQPPKVAAPAPPPTAQQFQQLQQQVQSLTKEVQSLKGQVSQLSTKLQQTQQAHQMLQQRFTPVENFHKGFTGHPYIKNP